MWDWVRRFGAAGIGVAVVLTWGRPALSQAPAANPNVYVNPFAAGARFPGAAALGAQNPGGGSGYGSLTPGGAAPQSYGTLSASYANPNASYGSLVNSNDSGGSGGYGGGYGMYGTQWMMNPYQGYLSGAADITRASAQYYSTIQQARLTREEARRSAFQTRRAMIEEIQWEREHMPDPDKIRQKTLERELSRARVSPPLNDIWDARSLNALLRYLIGQQGRLDTQPGQREREPNIPLNEDVLAHINYRIGNTRGNVGLLKDGGKLKWPLSLSGESFKEGREALQSLLINAYKTAEGDNNIDSNTLSDLRAHYKAMEQTLDANVNQMSLDDRMKAKRYLGQVKDSIDALKNPLLRKILTQQLKPNAHNVAELVRFLSKNGLEFAPASPKDEPAYVALYHALASFDRGMQRVASAADTER